MSFLLLFGFRLILSSALHHNGALCSGALGLASHRVDGPKPSHEFFTLRHICPNVICNHPLKMLSFEFCKNLISCDLGLFRLQKSPFSFILDRLQIRFWLQSEHPHKLQKWRCFLTYHKFSECSLKSPLLAEGSLGPKTCRNHIRKPNSKVTTQKLSNQHTPTLSTRMPSRRSGIHSKGRPACRPAETIGGLVAASARSASKCSQEGLCRFVFVWPMQSSRQ